MKIVKHSKLILILVVVIFLAGCADKSKLLVNTWAVDNLKYSSKVPAEMQQQVDQSIEVLRKTFRLTYNTDGTYTTSNNEQILKGKWKLNWNSSTITSTPDKGETKDFKIMELTENKFTFKAIEGGEEVIFEMKPAK